MFPLSFNTQCLRNLPLDRAIEVTAAAGYEGIDLAYRASTYTLSMSRRCSWMS